MAMDLSRKGASGERKMLGIPIVSLAVIAAVFMCVVYYASGYASENTKLIEKYGIARTKILSLSRMVEKMSSNQKICQSNLGQNEQSNKELTLQVSRCKSAKEEEETKSKQCQSQITTFQRFYSAVKEKLNHGENGEVTATVDTKSDLDNTIDGIVKLNAKISKLEEDQSKCSEVEKEFEELKRSTETTNSQIKALATEKEALNDELKNVRKLLEEANAKISNFDDHQHKRSFQRKKIPEQDRNVKEEILNEKKEQPKPVNHESGVVDSLNKASSVSGNNSASSVVHKAINVTSSDARNTTPTEADSEQTTTNTSTSFTKTNTSTASPELSTTTKKALVTEEDDDLEGGFNDTADEQSNKEDFDAEPKNNPEFVPANMK
ncbi:uncharacterized protein [Clytia hemisphaerica]|uniref:Uncharacterized protein n=1 Tax=Clytia hemisphaerica TaxID=252671 RepID=A0A7M5UNJ8_9CNID